MNTFMMNTFLNIFYLLTNNYIIMYEYVIMLLCFDLHDVILNNNILYFAGGIVPSFL